MIELRFLEFLEVLKLSRLVTGCSLLERRNGGASQIGQNLGIGASSFLNGRQPARCEQ
jgi:hypothetical protein